MYCYRISTSDVPIKNYCSRNKKVLEEVAQFINNKFNSGNEVIFKSEDEEMFELFQKVNRNELEK